MRTLCKKPGLFLRCLLLFPLFALATGCGGKEGTVSGKVYYKGQLLKGGIVNIFPEGKGGNYSANIASDGSYSIAKVPPGPAKITVLYSTENPLAKMAPMQMGAAKKGMDQQKEIMGKAMEGAGPASAPSPSDIKSLPEKYGAPEKSGLEIKVTGGKQRHDIKME